jgi:hypothetical protein
LKGEQEHASFSDTSLVLSTLEHDQLVAAKREPVPRRKLKGLELVLAWALRLYVVFMMVVVIWQAWLAVK